MNSKKINNPRTPKLAIPSTGINTQSHIKTTSKELLNLSSLEVFGKNRKELSKIVSQLAAVANKRISNIQAQDLFSPAYQSFQKYGADKASATGKTLNELRSEYTRIKYFLKAKTSTVQGAKKYQNETEKRILDTFGDDFPRERIKDVYSILHKMQEVRPNEVNEFSSTRLVQAIRDEFYGSNNIDDIENRINDILESYSNDLFNDDDEEAISALFGKI